MGDSTLSVQENIKQWVIKNLTVPRSVLGGLPPCPYASEALLQKQVSLLTLNSENVFVEVEEALVQFPKSGKKMFLLIMENGYSVDVAQTQTFVRRMRDKYFSQDLWLLYDHPALKELVSELSFNHGEYLLFMVQKLSDLVNASRDLKKTGYYQSWEAEYYDEVVGFREKYFEKMLASQLQETHL